MISIVIWLQKHEAHPSCERFDGVGFYLSCRHPKVYRQMSADHQQMLEAWRTWLSKWKVCTCSPFDFANLKMNLWTCLPFLSELLRMPLTISAVDWPLMLISQRTVYSLYINVDILKDIINLFSVQISPHVLTNITLETLVISRFQLWRISGRQAEIGRQSETGAYLLYYSIESSPSRDQRWQLTL